MNRRAKRSTLLLFALALLVFSALVGWRLATVPEPRHMGIGLGTYLMQWQTNRLQVREAVSSIGTNAVPYLIQEMRRNSLAEILIKVGAKVPASVRPILPDPRKYQLRRLAATDLLFDYPEALPAALDLLEQGDHSSIMQSCLMIVRFHALGSPYEERALKTLVNLTRHPDRSIRQHAIGNLTKYKDLRWSDDVVPALISGLYYPGMGPHLIDALVTFGPTALPYLKVAAVSEAMTNVHIRPASVALEKIEQQLRKLDHKYATNSKGNL